MDAMETVTFDYNSTRAAKARFGYKLGGSWKWLLLLVGMVCFFGGAALVAVEQPVGWAFLGCIAFPLMLRSWYRYELKQLPVAKQPIGVDALLSSDVLGILPRQPSPYDLATATGMVPSGQFFGARFGIGTRFLQEISPKEPERTAVVWTEAMTIREQLGLTEVTAGIIVVALVRTFPGYESLLAHLHLDDEDLTKGIMWQQHIQDLVVFHSRPKRTGGIARDWSFGYIPLLTRFGQNISEQISRGGLLDTDLEAHTQALDQLLTTFTRGGRQNAVLVGSPGAGKTTIVHAFAEKLLDASSHLPENLKFRQVFILDASSLLAAAPGRGELENLIMQVLGEAYSAKNIIICLDNAQLFFEEGVGSVDLTNVLLPILEAGNLRMILTMDEQRFLQIGQRNSGLVNALNRITIGPATKDETIAVMQDRLIVTEFRQKVTFTFQSLEEAYRLSERYVHDLAMPGRAVKMMETAAGYSEDGLVTMNSVQQAIEQTMDIKVGVASDEDERTKLLNLEQLIHERMINQVRAVNVVSDALRRARAGVRNQNRPIGTFLFLGPTGVGKTELAKALADVYFGGEKRMIRLDLNEYVRSEDVARLIADGADDPTSLTAQAMKQPFSVVLLDEIEKAHPNVLTTLLQLLDEGILRDIKNREVSFRDAIVIATSNAGADRIREYIERGYQLEQFEKPFIDELINTNQFRPEFLNRFDEIVVFRPLGKDELLQVIDLILAGVNKTLALQKISVSVAQDAKIFLVERGYDPRLGARPMRRVVQRAVENTVAKQMLAGSVAPGSVVEITLEQVQQILGSEMQANAIAAPSQNEQLQRETDDTQSDNQRSN
jgi:ATP-dependent Clp protease ATP-binding subunit ClpC